MTGFSILIPARNADKYIVCCLESIVNQIDENDEIIVVENNSEDTTKKVLKEYSKRHPCCKCIFLDDTISLFESRKLAINNATCDYLIFLDSDDLLMGNCMKTLRNTIEELKSPDMIIYRTMFFNEDGNIHESENFFDVEKGIILDQLQIDKLNKLFLTSDKINNVWIKCIKRELVEKEYLNFNKYSNYTFCEDKINTSIFLKHSKKIVYSPLVLHKYRKHQNAATRKVSKAWIKESIHEVFYFNKIFAEIQELQSYIYDCNSFFKKQYTRLLVWYIGQNILSVNEMKHDLRELELLLKENSIAFRTIKCKEKKYDIMFLISQKRYVILLKILCKAYIRIMEK